MDAEQAMERLKELNSECKDCQKELGEGFRPSMCKYCKIGDEIHKLSVQTSPAEKAWDALNWTSSKNEDLYQG